MRILLTNDDGVHAPGMTVLEDIARSISDDVWVVAPLHDQSGQSRAITLKDPLRLDEVSAQKYSLTGTPADCVMMGVLELMPSRPDLILSGVNAGQNTADHIGYSGTVAGAMEGAFLGVCSIALSQAADFGSGDPKLHWDTALQAGRDLLPKILDAHQDNHTVYNINFPHCTAENIQGVMTTRQGRIGPSMYPEMRLDGRNTPYYWNRFSSIAETILDGTDRQALRDDYISVTPLTADLTAHHEMDYWAERLK
jgi:5'-nucleotidase